MFSRECVSNIFYVYHIIMWYMVGPIYEENERLISGEDEREEEK